jgi:pyruvate dehydrogenase (quinone)
VVIEVKADPDIPPLPPHITLAQARAFASTLIRRDPNEGNVIVETAKQVLDAVLPGHRDK